MAAVPFLALCLILGACAGKQPGETMIPPETSPLSRAVIGYGVVTANYTHVMDRQGEGGKSLGFLRKGAIVEVLERRLLILNDGGARSGGGLPQTIENWVLARGSYRGWLKEDKLRIYDTEAKAKTASEQMPK